MDSQNLGLNFPPNISNTEAYMIVASGNTSSYTLLTTSQGGTNTGVC